MGEYALIVVDMQTAFVDPQGGLGVAGADEVVRAVNRHVPDAGEHRRPVWPTACRAAG